MFWNKSNKPSESELKAEYLAETRDLLIKINSATERTGLYARIGGGNDNADTLHNIYEDFGYPDCLEFSNFWDMYRRFGVASAVVDIPANLSWLQPPEINGGDSFNKELKDLISSTKLWNRLKGLDKRQRVGRYAGLFIQAADGKVPSEPLESLNGINTIRNLKPIYEGQLRVSETNNDVTSEDFDKPSMYEFTSSGDGQRNERENRSFSIHPSRIIIAAEGADDGSIYGISALENIYNDLIDLRKISGAGGEGFYQNTRSAPVISAKEGYTPPSSEKEKEKLESEIDSFLKKWQKKFVSSGLEFDYPDISLTNPKEYAENSKNNIAAGSGMASAILFGQQMGVRASDKDFELLMVIIQSRRENFLDELVRDFIDRMIAHNVLPVANYEITWPDMTAPSDDDRIELAKKMTEVNEKAFRSSQPLIFTEDEIREVSGYEPLKFEIPTESLEDDIDEDMDDDE